MFGMTFLYMMISSLIMVLGWLYVHGKITRLMWSLRDGLPPGPLPLPFLGNLLELVIHPNEFLHHSFTRLSYKYGPILYLRLGTVHSIIVSNPKLVIECLRVHDETFASRPSLEIANYLFYGSEFSVAFGKYGPKWRDLRKVCILHALRPQKVHLFGLVIQEEVQICIDNLTQHAHFGSHVDLTNVITTIVENITCRLMLGKCASELVSLRLGGKSLRDLIISTSSVITMRLVSTWIPSLGFMDKKAKHLMSEMRGFFDILLEELLEEREQRNQMNSLPTQKDFLDNIMATNWMTRKEIKNILFEAITLTLDSTSTTIDWAMAEILKHPTCLHKLQEELDKLDCQEMVDQSHLDKLPYLRAVVNETLRLHIPLPTLIPHNSTQSCQVGDYNIPKDTCLFLNVWAITRDHRIWGNPHEFMPERFLNENNPINVHVKNIEVLPFGIGRRGCPGYHFALSIIELTLSNMLYKFDWRLPHGKDIDMSEKRITTISRKEPLMIIPILRRH